MSFTQSRLAMNTLLFNILNIQDVTGVLSAISYVDVSLYSLDWAIGLKFELTLHSMLLVLFAKLLRGHKNGKIECIYVPVGIS